MYFADIIYITYIDKVAYVSYVIWFVLSIQVT